MRLIICLLIMSALVACTTSNSPTQYIICSPELAEIVVLLGKTSQVVAVSSDCDYPLSLNTKQKVGAFGTLDIEKIISLNPKKVILADLEQKAIAHDLNKLGITTITFHAKSIEDIFFNIKALGKEFNCEARAAFCVDSLQTELSTLQDNPPNSPRVYVEIYASPLMSCADSSYVGSLINIAGGENIFPSLLRQYARVSSEDVINAKPQVIISFSHLATSEIQNRLGWQDIPAIINQRIYTEKDIDADLVMRAGPRFILGIKELRRVIKA